VVIGVSPDDVKQHCRFKKKYGLPYTLIADTDHVVARAYGVWQKKSMFGRKYFGIVRTTFLIAPDGRIARVFDKVEPEGHATEVLVALKTLRG
jgi:peroxiredoxin Q/BCP